MEFPQNSSLYSGNEQLQEVLEAKKQPIVFDDDSPELSLAMYKAFKSSAVQRNRKKKCVVY